MPIIIVIFDDEPDSLARTRALVERLAPATNAATSILEAMDLRQLTDILEAGTHVDVLVADIMMPEGQPSGIDVVQSLFPPESGTQVIYTSGFLEQSLEVYRTDHLYFLLKPIDPDRLRDALCRAFEAVRRRQPPMLRIKISHRDQLVNVSTIIYLESSLHKVSVHCLGATYETYAKLGDLQEQLPESFSRCHRSILVNLAFVRSLGDDMVHLADGTALPVSRRRMQEVQRDLLSYLSSSNA